jgi:hypothetical protein
MKYIFEIRKYDGENKIFINDQLFDWRIDEGSINKIKQIKDKKEIEKINNNIKDYLLGSLEEFIGKKITIKELIDALKEGHLEI